MHQCEKNDNDYMFRLCFHFLNKSLPCELLLYNMKLEFTTTTIMILLKCTNTTNIHNQKKLKLLEATQS